MMSFSFVVSYFVAVLLIWALWHLAEWYLDKRKHDKYARNHFELTERFRNGL